MAENNIFQAFIVCRKKIDKGFPVAESEESIAIFKELCDACKFADMKSKSSPDPSEYTVISFGRWPVQ